MVSVGSKIENRSPTLNSGASYTPVNLGMQSQSSDRSGTGKLVARDAKDVNRKHSSRDWEPVAKTFNRLGETRLAHHNFPVFSRWSILTISRESFLMYDRN